MTRLAIGVVAMLVAQGAAAQSNIGNAQLQERSAGDLARTIDQLAAETGPFWIAYAVPAHGDWNACCHGHPSDIDSCCGRCSLEQKDGSTNVTRSSDRTVQLEPAASASAVVLLRVQDRRVHRVRVFSNSCQIDAGGRAVHWLTGVSPAGSVAVLKRLVRESTSGAGESRSQRDVMSGGLLAITAHQAPEAVTTLIDLARNDPETKVRSEALFWLAHRAGQKAAGTITDAIANDPDTKVKERAVFALSQLPKDEGVPRLIEVARTNRNGRVRQQAVFWLGQSKDPRALRFFEEILLR